MSLRVIRPVRYSAAAVVVLASLTTVAADDETAPVASEDRRVAVQHRETRFASVWPQEVQPGTTLVGRKDRKKVRVDSPRGGRVWTASDLADNDVPEAAMRAYRTAAHRLSLNDPGCDLTWTLLAAIGRVESDHGRFAGAVVGTDGVARPGIIGVALNGVGPVAAIRDSDDGRLDGDKKWDRAVGPMQFIPTTWAWAGRDGDGNGVRNPHDLDDAALAAGDYLCAGTSMSSAAGMKAAIFRYNPSDDYVALVRAFERGYRTGVFVIPSPETEKDQAATKDRRKKKDARKDRGKDRTKKDAKKDGKKDGKKKDRTKDRDGKKKDRGSGGKDGKDGKDGNKGGKPSKPAPKPRPKPAPKPAPTPSSPPAQQPNPAPQPPAQGSPAPSSPSPSPTGPRDESGTVTACGGGWCLRGVPLRFSGGPATMDLNGDGQSGTLDQEMAELASRGQVETMTVRGDNPYDVVRIGSVTFG